MVTGGGLKDTTWRSSLMLVPQGHLLRVLPLAPPTAAPSSGVGGRATGRGGGDPGGAGQDKGADAYNASAWLEEVVRGRGIPRTDRILQALQGGVGGAGVGGACGVEGKREGSGGLHMCAGGRSGRAGRRRDDGVGLARGGLVNKGVGLARGSWERKVVVEVIGGLQRVLVHAVAVLSDRDSPVCSSDCLDVLGALFVCVCVCPWKLSPS